jgi:mannose-6-phosphate isomerase-like protein (cupin superfamily)
MAVTLEGGCRVSEMREDDPFTQGTLRIWNRIGRATGAQAISLRVMEFASGLSPSIKNDECHEILYVLSRSSLSHHHDREAVGDSSQGQARSAPPLDHAEFSDQRPEGVRERKHVAVIEIDGHSYDIGPDTGIYIRPHQTYAIDNPGPNPIVIISSQCPDPDRAPRFVEPVISSDSARSDRPPLVRLADCRAQPTADRWYRVLVDEEVGSTQVTQFVGSIPPGRAPDHFHHYEEVLFILKGEGRMWAGETNTPIAEGSCIYLPKGQVHCVENTGSGELRLLGVFYPAGSPSVRYDV